MAEDIKLTKMELRSQQVKLAQLQKYLPTLQLKKAMLQVEVNTAQHEINQLKGEFKSAEERVLKFSRLLSDKSAPDLFSAIKIHKVGKKYENIAGIDVPYFEGISFEAPSYALFDTPLWMESAVLWIHDLLTLREKIKIGYEKKTALEKELREVSIRVNLFEKIMIPRALGNIKKIKIFLGDQQLAAVSQAKIAKRKILMKMDKEAT
ncbi:MAG: V-type ATP synthase subunit D [Chlamydiota bacterium]